MRKYTIVVVSALLFLGLITAFTSFATDDNSVSANAEAAQILTDSKNALKAFKSDGSSKEETIKVLENSIKKLEALTQKLETTQKSTLPKSNNANPFDNDFFQAPFDAKNWNPLQEMQAMQNQMNQLFGQAFGKFDNSYNFNQLIDNNGFSPNINLAEKDNNFVVTVDVPGTKADGVDVTLKDQMLTIKGSTVEENKSQDNNGHVYRQERFSGHFSRSIRLPAPVKSSGMTTEVKNGVLEVTIPKA